MSEQRNNKKKQNDDLMRKIRILPDFVYDNLLMNEGINANIEIIEKYKLNDEQRKNMLSLNLQIIFKEIGIEDLYSAIEKRLKVDTKIAQQITTDLFTKKFYLAKDYFPGIKDEILKLGGEIPKTKSKKTSGQLLKREKEMKKMKEEKERIKAERLADTIIKEPIKNLIKKYPEIGHQQIGSQKSIIIKEMPVPMKPLIKYWIKDYLEKMGHYEHSNIDRVKYVYHDKNTRKMNDEERRQLNLVLKSLDEGILLAYSTRRRKVDFSKTNQG